MREYIKKLQSKDEIVRKQILLILMVVSMLFVVVIFSLSLGWRFKKTSKVEVKESAKPFALFANSLGEAYSNISASVGNVSSINKNPISNLIPEKEKQIDLIPVEYSNN